MVEEGRKGALEVEETTKGGGGVIGVREGKRGMACRATARGCARKTEENVLSM
jgi:hypothetical protein